MYRKSFCAAVAACVIGTMGHAAPLFNVNVLDYDTWAEKASNALAYETFEQTKDVNDSVVFEGATASDPSGRSISGGAFDGFRFGELGSAGYNSHVGQFTTLPGVVGSGSTCRAFDLGAPGCTGIALQFDPAVNGQGNTAPDLVVGGQFDGDPEFDQQGIWALNSNDTNGIAWSAGFGGQTFNSLFFILRDAADAGKKSLEIDTTISIDGVQLDGSFTDQRLRNDNRLLVMINFSEGVTAADVAIRTSQNDGFTFDGAGGLNVVPLPASILFLLGGLGFFGVMRRRARA
ncbi:MAG: VPLPA-CTERM sorting domain-containing protein [Roseobacter sp.]